ncbi:beta-ketoacyl synthase N-terminal-like domain-containing protein [Streptomyces parvus]|uniref:beta-ketoacyl synthase N-terminal-like domain-containing protein n=1 Tax=Streptomyces parvus TaxID=66428 RepID=UPI00370FF5A8
MVTSIEGEQAAPVRGAHTSRAPHEHGPGRQVAIIGMACRLPGAPDPETFWTNLREGVESITRRDPEPVPGVRADGTTGHYTPGRGLLKDPEWFDAGHFGYPPREARLISPQHRLFLECAADALADAGQDPARSRHTFGIFGGGTDIGYAQTLRERRHELPAVTDWEILLGSAPDFMVTRAAYKLGLTGPAVTVQTACSTALVAVHTAVRSLLTGECDVALAGAAAVHVPAKESQYTPGGIISAQGKCRAFDADADGTVGGDGVGIVVLKRLADAQADGDRILAVVRGSAVNNDGADRVGYTAPSVTGQSAVIRAAHRDAEIDAAGIGYVEAHGTATPLGDPIELTALSEAFAKDAPQADRCLIGSVKTNIGHVDAAAGAAGLIKTVLALHHGAIPPSLHFERPNPQFDFASAPFRVVTDLTGWPAGDIPRRAAVSAFGIGGTNAHVVVEEAPPKPDAAPSTLTDHLLVLSADTPTALTVAASRLAERLRTGAGDAALADIAWTLQTGRRERERRAYLVAHDTADATAALAGPHTPRLVVTADDTAADREIVFRFRGASAGPASGARVVAPSPERYAAEPTYRAAVDACRAASGFAGDAHDDILGADVRAGTPQAVVAAFAQAYARAMTWIDLGIRPRTVLCGGAGVWPAAAVVKSLPLLEAVHLALVHSRTGRVTDQDAEWRLMSPKVPVIFTGLDRPFTDAEAKDPQAWAAAAEEADSDNAALVLVADPAHLVLDTCARLPLSDPVRTQPGDAPEDPLPPAALGDDRHESVADALDTLGRLWLGGAAVSWGRLHNGQQRSLVPLPTYPYEREPFLVEPAGQPAGPAFADDRSAEPPSDAPREVLPVLLSLYAEVLGFAEVSATDDFFDLGGDSLLAARLTERIRQAFPVDVDVLTVIEAAQPVELAAVVEQLLAS